jgi:hypothetical protein
MFCRTVVLFVPLLLALPAVAQHAGHHPPSGAPPATQGSGAMQPYAGLADRRIKALSEGQIAELRAGRGMALALAAELNGYPGPMHVIEHADALGLTAAQRGTAEALRERMGAEARSLGARIVVLEEELDALFRDGDADVGRLAGLTAQLGSLAGRLREVHLAAHLEMRAALSAAQRDTYAHLRGYMASR